MQQAAKPIDTFGISLLKGAKPFDSNVVSEGADGWRMIVKRYCIKDNFDHAASQITKELGTSPASVQFNEFIYRPNTSHAFDDVHLQRGKVVFGIKQPKGLSGVIGSEALTTYHLPKLDPTGWVTISVVRRLYPEKGVKLPALTHNPSRPYCIVSWYFKNGDQPLDVHRGTVNMEDHTQPTYFFYRSGGNGTTE